MQRLLSETITRIPIDPNMIETLEQFILNKFQEGQTIKQIHTNRHHAWTNDLSLICLLQQLESPVKYIVTNDHGLQVLVRCLYPHKDAAYYLRSLTDFLTSLDILIQTGQKSFWEQMIYETKVLHNFYSHSCRISAVQQKNFQHLHKNPLLYEKTFA